MNFHLKERKRKKERRKRKERKKGEKERRERKKTFMDMVAIDRRDVRCPIFRKFFFLKKKVPKKGFKKKYFRLEEKIMIQKRFQKKISKKKEKKNKKTQKIQCAETQKKH